MIIGFRRITPDPFIMCWHIVILIRRYFNRNSVHPRWRTWRTVVRAETKLMRCRRGSEFIVLQNIQIVFSEKYIVLNIISCQGIYGFSVSWVHHDFSVTTTEKFNKFKIQIYSFIWTLNIFLKYLFCLFTKNIDQN